MLRVDRSSRDSSCPSCFICLPLLLCCLRSLADSSRPHPTCCSWPSPSHLSFKEGHQGWTHTRSSGAAGKSMGSHSLLWRLAAWLLVMVLQSLRVGSLDKNRSCISYGSNVLTKGVEHLRGLILEGGRNGTIQCPHNQCCFGIWNLTQGQLQVKVQGEIKVQMEELDCFPRG